MIRYLVTMALGWGLLTASCVGFSLLVFNAILRAST